MSAVSWPYRLGLPAWAFPGWTDHYWPAKPSALANYAQFFNCVEGNTTFYRIPEPGAIASWRSAVSGTSFKFCFKLPRAVTHERPASATTLMAFIRALEPLEGHLGPFLVQFPAQVGPAYRREIELVLERLPAHWDRAVEVRHPQFFRDPEILTAILVRHNAARVVMDTRALYQGDLQHPDVLRAVHEKPDLPVIKRVYNDLAFVRIVLHPDPRYNSIVLNEWTTEASRYLAGGVRSYIMIHCPNNLHCPEFARSFHERLSDRAGQSDLPELPPWSLPQQTALF